MFESIIELFDFDFSSWLDSVVASFTTTYEVSEGVFESTIANIPWSALVPWKELFAFICLIVFIVLIFKFLRSVICRVL